ncbi:MAG: thiolase family protein [Planctomycetota bacterium]|nr:thiolase family protein [Planctomycetota bacterium]
MSTQPEIVLAAGLRLPQARAGGAYKREDAGHLGAAVTRELMARTGLSPDAFDEVIAGCVGQPHDQANLARVVALRAGLPQATPAYTVARNCASGMEAVTSAVTQIMAGRGDTFLCLGIETMSAYPLLFNQKATDFFGRLAFSRSIGAKLGAITSWRPSMLAPRIALVEGLTDPTNDLIMGSTAENLARDFELSRLDADTYAAESHTRAAAARDAGRFAKEIMPYFPMGASKKQKALAADDSIRDGQSVEALAKLRPYFEKPDGVVTVGNACGITDGATALVVTTKQRALALGLKPLATIKSFAWAGCDPSRMGLGPVFATAKCLDQAGVTLDDVGPIELNEAFAVQVLACRKAFASDSFAQKHLGRSKAMGEVSLAQLNPNGGAIAIGHPVGATGARILLTSALELEAGDHELGLATLCIGGGQGGAVLLERCSA